ncbi:MAG: dynamin family protein [Bryobacteraceae bacterium]
MKSLDTHEFPETAAPAKGLEQHLKLKLELAAIIRAVMQLFHQQGDDRREHQARALLSRLADDQFNLAVVGQFNRGKSSLMNAVIGMDRLPTGVLPLTSVVTTVRYGDRERVLVRTRGASLPYEIPLAELQDHVTERGNPGNRRQVVLAEVQLPAEVLRLGFRFIDTPGVGSAIAANTATTQRFLPEADAVVFVTSFEAAMNEGELAFLGTVARHAHKIFLVVNKRDLVSEEECETVLESVRKTISLQLGEAAPRMFAVSAREALQAKLAGDREMLTHSGFPEFESALTHFLTAEKAHVSLVRLGERTRALLTPELVESRASSARTGLDSDAVRSMRDEWEKRIKRIEAECLRASDSLRRHVRSELPSRLRDAIEGHCAEVGKSLQAQVERVLERREWAGTAQELQRLAEGAQEVADKRLSQWLAARQAEFASALRSLSAEGVSQLEGLNREALESAAELFGLPPAEVAEWTANADEAAFRWTTATPLSWSPRFAWELELFAPEWLRRRVLREYRRTLEAAVSAYRDRVAEGVAEAGGEWAADLGAEALRNLKHLGSQVASVIEGHGTSPLAGKAVELLSRLDKVRRELVDGGAGETVAGAWSPMDKHPATRPCFICERIAAELFDFFSQRQYDLATNEAQQRAHTANGGFCPLHTWQYERIASPHGVCLSYAPLLAAVARHLRSIASSASSVGSMLDRVQDVYPSAGRCAACQRTAEAERAAVEQYRQAAAGRGVAGSTLCMPHLGAVLGRETDIEAARSLIFEQARTLERISEDMQTYALKHEAARRELMSGEEWSAYMTGLSLLAGNRKLSTG